MFRGWENLPATLQRRPKNRHYKTDIINSYIHLLLFRGSMKRAIMNINFKDDTASVFSLTELVGTKGGHYAIS